MSESCYWLSFLSWLFTAKLSIAILRIHRPPASPCHLCRHHQRDNALRNPCLSRHIEEEEDRILFLLLNPCYNTTNRGIPPLFLTSNQINLDNLKRNQLHYHAQLHRPQRILIQGHLWEIKCKEAPRKVAYLPNQDTITWCNKWKAIDYPLFKKEVIKA